MTTIRCPKCGSDDVTCSKNPHNHTCHACTYTMLPTRGSLVGLTLDAPDKHGWSVLRLDGSPVADVDPRESAALAGDAQAPNTVICVRCIEAVVKANRKAFAAELVQMVRAGEMAFVR